MYYEAFEKLCKAKNVTAADVSRATGIATATLSNWKNGNYTPKSDKLKVIADYFEVTLDFITGEEIETENGKKYYFNDETAQIAQSLFEQKDLRMLFDAAQDCKPEDLKMAADLLKRLKGTNADG